MTCSAVSVRRCKRSLSSLMSLFLTTGVTWWPCSTSTGPSSTKATRKGARTCEGTCRRTRAGSLLPLHANGRLQNGFAYEVIINQNVRRRGTQATENADPQHCCCTEARQHLPAVIGFWYDRSIARSVASNPERSKRYGIYNRGADRWWRSNRQLNCISPSTARETGTGRGALLCHRSTGCLLGQRRRSATTGAASSRGEAGQRGY